MAVSPFETAELMKPNADGRRVFRNEDLERGLQKGAGTTRALECALERGIYPIVRSAYPRCDLVLNSAE